MDIDYKSLPYPLFETTEEEKQLLISIKPAFEDIELRTHGLCGQLGDTPLERTLVRKIHRSISKAYVTNYFISKGLIDVGAWNNTSYEEHQTYSKQIRIHWIDALLAYNPSA